MTQGGPISPELLSLSKFSKLTPKSLETVTDIHHAPIIIIIRMIIITDI